MSNSPPQANLPQDSMTPPERPNGPQISRKVKACAACRKQKVSVTVDFRCFLGVAHSSMQIKCLMDNGEPPCRRCIERNLSCVLNKSLQTLISERSQWKEDMHRDISTMHGAVQDILKRLSMPPIQPLKAPTNEDAQETSPYDDTVVEKVEDVGPSCDNSPKLAARTESLQNVPIESLYQITRLRSFRAENSGDESKTDEGTDVISKGIVPLEDAERLTTLYLGRLDHYAYSIANKFANLQSIRRRSVALTNAIMTVSALHDPHSNQLFGPCFRELKRVLSESMFDRRIDREYLRAMCIGSFWLSDISYTLSGHAIRRAMGINLSSNYYRVLKDGSEDAADCLRLWYMLYICDQHLSILYGRSTIIRVDDPSLQGWEQFLEKHVAVEQDRRTASQVSLMIIMGSIRDFFERNKGDSQTLSQNFTEHLANFDRQLDLWMEKWFKRLSTYTSCSTYPNTTDPHRTTRRYRRLASQRRNLTRQPSKTTPTLPRLPRPLRYPSTPLLPRLRHQSRRRSNNNRRYPTHRPGHGRRAGRHATLPPHHDRLRLRLPAPTHHEIRRRSRSPDPRSRSHQQISPAVALDADGQIPSCEVYG